MVGTQGTWMIGFGPCKDMARFWRLFTREGFQHCFAMRLDPHTNVWLFFEWSGWGTNVESMGYEEGLNLMAWLSDNGGTMLSVEATREKYSAFPKLTWCVPAIAHLLGIKTAAITPWQLFCALRQKGGRVIFSPEHPLDTPQEQANG